MKHHILDISSDLKHLISRDDAREGENAHKASLQEEDTLGSDWDLASGKASDGKQPERGNRHTQPTGTRLTRDIVYVLTEQHNRLMLALAAQTQKLEAHTQQLDKLERVCLHRTSRCSDEPMLDQVLQTVGDLKQGLGVGKLRSSQQFLAVERARERRLSPRSLQQHVSAHDVASPLCTGTAGGPYSPPFDKGQRVKESRGRTAREQLQTFGNTWKTERLQALDELYLKYQEPSSVSAAATNGICEGTPTVLKQAELVHMSNHTGERRGGRDTGRLPILSLSESRARSSLRPESDMTDQSRSDPCNRVIQDINLFRAVSQSPTSEVSLAPPSAAKLP